jgi:hypothetical protein
LLVTANLQKALVALRKAEPRILWDDAICMDQTNILERNHQVQLMWDIYSGAEDVAIWLGQFEIDIKNVEGMPL